MIDIQNTRINTAGAYVSLNGLYVFAVGIQTNNNRIPIIRLGGHREESETGWQCAEREVFEEASLQIKPLPPQTTYLCNWDNLDRELQRIEWRHKTEQEPAPCLVITYRHEETTTLSLMYLSHTDGIPAPSSEVKGLLLLQETEIHRLCKKPMTLQQYLDCGGKAILKDEFDTRLLLEPFAQLRLLSRILLAQSKINLAQPRLS